MSVHFDLYSIIIYVVFALIGLLCCSKIKFAERTSGIQVGLKSQYYFIWIVSWSMLAAIRIINSAGVGGMDAYMYVDFFRNCDSFEKMLSTRHFDIGFKVLTYLIRLITRNYHFYAFVCAFIMVCSYAFIIKKIFPENVETIPLVLMFYIFLRGFTTFRTNLSVAFLLFGLAFLYEKRYFKSAVLMIISVLFHKSSIIYVLVFPYIIMCNKRKLKVKEAIGLVLLGIAFGKAAQTLLLGSFGASLGDAYSSYASRSVGTSFFDGFWKIAVGQLLLAVAMLVLRKKYNKEYSSVNEMISNKLKFVWNVCIFDFIMIPTTYIISMWRGYEYLYIIRLIMWGALLNVILKSFTPKSRKIVRMIALLVSIIWLIWRICETYESSGLLPYAVFI